MEAVVPLKWIKKHRASLIEDRVYRLRYLEIVDARNSHRLVPHPFMTRLIGHTQIVEVTHVPQSFPLYACSIASFATLRTRSVYTDDMSGTLYNAFFWPMFVPEILNLIWHSFLTTDCIGIFSKCSRVMNQKTRFGEKTLLNVHITDGRCVPPTQIYFGYLRQLTSPNASPYPWKWLWCLLLPPRNWINIAATSPLFNQTSWLHRTHTNPPKLPHP